MSPCSLVAVASLAACWLSLATHECAAQTVIDLTHPIPTFHQSADNPARPDTNRPWTQLGTYPIYGEQAVLWLRQIPTSHGHIESGRVTLWEHQGTHIDAPSHFLNTPESTEALSGATPRRLQLHEIDARRLVGPAVIIDISERVRRELAKNGGRPSPDRNITDFSENSGSVVTAEDVEAISDQLGDGVWLVINLGWSEFFTGDPSIQSSPYINRFNHPGMSRKATDKLIEIMDRKQVKISGIMADNIAVETGQVAHGDDDKRTNALHGHVRLLQRDILIVENVTNLDQLTRAAKAGRCIIVVGAIKLGGGTGGPARVLALCG
jgi:kynurenine formamidase